MLNSTKTWQEEKINHTAEHIGIISRGVLETLVREVIAQTREETIREVEEILYEVMEMGYSIRDIIDKINKLKK